MAKKTGTSKKGKSGRSWIEGWFFEDVLVVVCVAFTLALPMIVDVPGGLEEWRVGDAQPLTYMDSFHQALTASFDRLDRAPAFEGDDGTPRTPWAALFFPMATMLALYAWAWREDGAGQRRKGARATR